MVRPSLWALALLSGCLARFAPAQAPACQPLEGDQIKGKDLAIALPLFRAIPPDTVLGNAPQPGTRRIFHPEELASLARRYSVALEGPSEVCFEWPMEPLQASRVLESMRVSLAAPDARIELAEISTYPVPRGSLEFARGHLVAPPAASHAPALWRGEVVYGSNHRYPIWARVRITAQCTHVMAAETLKAGLPVEANQVRLESATCFPAPEKIGSALDQVVGMKPLRPIAAGSPVRRDWLAEPNDVNRGDAIQVEVRSGAAHLAFTGKAESGGRAGDLIAVRNPSSNKIFQARVDGKGKAVVLANSAKVQ